MQEKIVTEPVILQDQKWIDNRLYCTVAFGNAFSVNGCVIYKTEDGAHLEFPRYVAPNGDKSPLTIFHRTLYLKAVSVALSSYDTLAAVLAGNNKEEQ